MRVLDQAAEFLDSVHQSLGFQLNAVVIADQVREVPELTSTRRSGLESSLATPLDPSDAQECPSRITSNHRNECLFSIGEFNSLTVVFAWHRDRTQVLNASSLASGALSRLDVLHSTSAGQTLEIDRI
jgi:hypothetical protein